MLTHPQLPERWQQLIQGLIYELTHIDLYEFKSARSPNWEQVAALNPEEQLEFTLAIVEWFNYHPIAPNVHSYTNQRLGYLRLAMLALLRHKLPWSHDDLLALLTWSISQEYNYVRGVPQIIKAVETYLNEQPLTPAITEKIGELIGRVEAERATVETRQWVIRLKELGQIFTSPLPLTAGEEWADAAIKDIHSQEAGGESSVAVWAELLSLCAGASGSQPTAKWLKSARSLFEALGFPVFKRAMLKWFPLVDKSHSRILESAPHWYYQVEQANSDILKGLVWLCAGKEDPEIARALTILAMSSYRKVPQIGPRCPRVGNACIWALGRMPGTEGLGQLAVLKLKLKSGTAQKSVVSALAAVSARLGVSPDEIEELSSSSYGLQEVGRRREQLGDYVAELVVTGASTTELRWIKPDGKKASSVPRSLKEQYPAELKEIIQADKDLRKMLPAQRDRIENCYLERKQWRLKTWMERYLNHPLIGVIARRLIWNFTNANQTASGIWFDGKIVGSDWRPLDWLDDATEVELWHPIHERADGVTDGVMAWREWLTDHEVQQPFKQAHREIYLLTDAERATQVYSNRFAAHLIKQHQFNALCAVRGWKNQLRLMVDTTYPHPSRLMPKWNLRAEFWVYAIGENYGVDTNETGTYLYLSTDQVRFYPSGAQENQMDGSGEIDESDQMSDANGESRSLDPLELDRIPPLVFSEIMRDADLFVGVASVGNDPNWRDGRHRETDLNYWATYAFGELTETARTRRQVLERIIPRLKIGERCHFKDRFLVVRGDLRTYKIHLGSGNILMEPNDQYLCIVPASGTFAGQTGNGLAERIFLPFEGDKTLSIILSKAMLLANDQMITDPTIRRQIL